MTTHWTLTWTPAVWIGIVLVGGATAILCWLNWRRRGGPTAAVLEGMRFLTVLLILLTLLGPERVERETVTAHPEVVLLHDTSGSMETRDVVRNDGTVTARSAWLKDVMATNFWARLEPAARVGRESFPGTGDAGPAGATGTDLNAALESVAARQERLKAVLLLSDGDWNSGANPLQAAGRLRARQIPVFTVAVGSEAPLPDLILEMVSAPSYGLLGEQLNIPFRIRSFLPREVRTTITLDTAAGVMARQEVVVPPYGRAENAFLWMPRSVGEHFLSVTVPIEEGEYLEENNSRPFRVDVRTEKLRVLVIDSLPRWEYRYLRNALERDPGVDVHCLLLHPGMSAGQGTNYLETFPTRRDDLAQYDVVFVGDVGMGGGELNESDLELLRGLVEQQGSGLVFLPGRRGRLATLVESPIGDLLPIVPDPSRAEGIDTLSETAVELTSSGRRHFLTLLANHESVNASVWKRLPGFFWCAAVERAKPGSDILAVHASMRGAHGRMPLLATRPFGQGEALFMGIDSAWRWRRGVEDKYHYRFWGQVVRWMAHKRHMAEGEGLRLTFSPEQPKAQDQVFLQATVLDLLDWKEGEQVVCRVTTPAGRDEALEMELVPGGWGVYQGQFTAEQGGVYDLTLSGSRPGRRLSMRMNVESPVLEKVGQPANAALLREIAALTRGASGSAADLDELVERISLLPEAAPVERRFRLWADPRWGGFLFLMLAIYWTARKVAGML